jgi:predicted HicB family RNase H-like nuclease
MLTYKGYTWRVDLDPEAGVFHGKVLDLRDVVTFEGRNAEEVERAFRDSVDDYLEMCAECGEKPDRPPVEP